MLNNLPKNWCECKFSDVCYLQNGYAFDSKSYKEKGTYLIRISDIQNNEVHCTNCVKVTEEVDKCFTVSYGDFLLAMSGATTGKTGVYKDSDKALLNQRVGNLKIYDENIIIPKFRNYFISSKRQEIEKLAYGGAQPNISKSMIENLKMLLPPLEEQGRIVEKIEELFSDIDNGIKDLKTAQAQIKQYRQSVLKSAFEGKLYKTSEWKEVKLEDVCQINPKTEIKDMKDDDIVSFLPMTSVKAECNYYTEENVLYSKVKKGYTKFKNGDVLFAKITPCMENGKVCIVDNLIQDIGFGSTEFHILRCLNNIIPKYVYYVVIQQCFRKKAKKNMVGAVGQQRVPADFMKNFDILLPSLPEQQQIVAEIEKRFLVADELEKAVNEGLEKADKLKQSILKKAFEGKLVPQDPNDEPASALLKRIKKEQKPTKGKKK